jgi:Flp pilus assembly CpaE family ATPase
MTHQNLTILLIEDDPDFAQLVRRWLIPQTDSDFALLWKDSLVAGLQRLEQGGVDVVLLDLGLPDSNGIETFLRIKAQSKAVPIIVLSAGDDESLALQMVQKGAQDYIVKGTCKGDVLIKAIRYALVRQIGQTTGTAAPNLAKTIGVLGAKGGAGTTTFACNLAVELRSQTKHSTLLLDLDVNAGLVGFLINTRSERSILDAVANIDRLDRSCWNGIVSHGPGDLELLQSPCLLGRGQLNPAQVREILSAVRSFYNWIVLDLGRLTAFSVELLGQADELYLFTTTQLPALYEAKRVVDALKELGFAMDRLRLIVSEINNSPTIDHSDLDRVFGIPVDLRLSDAGHELQEAHTAGKLPDKNGGYRKQIASLARKIAGLPAAEEASKRLLPRLFAKQAAPR